MPIVVKLNIYSLLLKKTLQKESYKSHLCDEVDEFPPHVSVGLSLKDVEELSLELGLLILRQLLVELGEV